MLLFLFLSARFSRDSKRVLNPFIRSWCAQTNEIFWATRAPMRSKSVPVHPLGNFAQGSGLASSITLPFSLNLSVCVYACLTGSDRPLD